MVLFCTPLAYLNFSSPRHYPFSKFYIMISSYLFCRLQTTRLTTLHISFNASPISNFHWNHFRLHLSSHSQTPFSYFMMPAYLSSFLATIENNIRYLSFKVPLTHLIILQNQVSIPISTCFLIADSNHFLLNYLLLFFVHPPQTQSHPPTVFNFSHICAWESYTITYFSLVLLSPISLIKLYLNLRFFKSNPYISFSPIPPNLPSLPPHFGPTKIVQ